MVRVKSPLFSATAQKQLGKSLIYKMKNGKAFVTAYNKPGGKNALSVSETQRVIRDFYSSVVVLWQAMSQEEKDVWNDEVKNKNLQMSGFNLFYQYSFNNQVDSLKDSIFGIRTYGIFIYGQS